MLDFATRGHLGRVFESDVLQECVRSLRPEMHSFASLTTRHRGDAERLSAYILLRTPNQTAATLQTRINTTVAQIRGPKNKEEACASGHGQIQAKIPKPKKGEGEKQVDKKGPVEGRPAQSLTRYAYRNVLSECSTAEPHGETFAIITVRQLLPTKESFSTWVSLEPRNGVWSCCWSNARMHSCHRVSWNFGYTSNPSDTHRNRAHDLVVSKLLV